MKPKIGDIWQVRRPNRRMIEKEIGSFGKIWIGDYKNGRKVPWINWRREPKGRYSGITVSKLIEFGKLISTKAERDKKVFEHQKRMGLLMVLFALLSIAATNYYGKTDLRERPALFPTNAPPTHLAAPVEFVSLMPPTNAVTRSRAATVPPATNRPIVLPAFKYPPPGSNQMWLIQSSTNRGVWQTIASGTNNVKTVSNRVWTTLLPFVLPAAGTLEITNKAPSASYRTKGTQSKP